MHHAYQSRTSALQQSLITVTSLVVHNSTMLAHHQRMHACSRIVYLFTRLSNVGRLSMPTRQRESGHCGDLAARQLSPQ